MPRKLVRNIKKGKAGGKRKRSAKRANRAIQSKAKALKGGKRKNSKRDVVTPKTGRADLD